MKRKVILLFMLNNLFLKKRRNKRIMFEKATRLKSRVKKNGGRGAVIVRKKIMLKNYIRVKSKVFFKKKLIIQEACLLKRREIT